MTLNVSGILRDAWALARHDRDVLVPLAGLLVFVPQLAILILLQFAPIPQFPGFGADVATTTAYTTASQSWFASNGLLALAIALVPILGRIAIVALYVDRAQPTVGQALGLAPLRFFPVVLLTAIASPLGVSLQVLPLLILPAAYLEGRLFCALPILLGERPVSVFGAVGRSWRRTRGHGLVTGGLACVTILGGVLIALPFVSLGASLDGAPLRNPIVAALLDGGAALGLTLGAVATLLVQVALYRRLSSGT